MLWEYKGGYLLFIYHYTDINLSKILKEGLLCAYKSEDTEVINDILNRVEKHPNWLDRNYCIFFQFHTKTEVGEYIVTVDVNALNQKELYVADLTVAQNIFNAVYYGKEDKFLTLANQYWDSVMPLEEYLRKNIHYEETEILYLCDVSPKQIHSIKKA